MKYNETLLKIIVNNLFKVLFIIICMEEYTVRIGKRLREVLDIQKKRIKEVTYDIVNASDLEAGEILADKILKNNLV